MSWLQMSFLRGCKLRPTGFSLCWRVPLAVCLLLAFHSAQAEPRWWKGNLHTHSLWSDGDDYPEMVVGWYKEHGYHFLSLSDHNIMLEGEKWIDVSTNRGGAEALDKYLQRHGTNWVQQRQHGGRAQIRLKTLEEFRGQFEKPSAFLLISGEEISARYENLPIHLNATHLRDLIPPQEGNSVADVLQKNVDAVLDQRKRTGQLMVPHINHPNFIWALTAEDLMRIRGDRFLEIYNGHPIVKDNGDDTHASTERIWDIILTRRLAEFGLDPIWGTAVDDAHNYHSMKVGNANPGRGWLMVRAEELKPESILMAMEKGDFYATSGVRLKKIDRSKERLCLEIEAEPGVKYKTQFIGTRKGYDPTNTPVVENGKEVRTTRRYSKDIGKLLAEVDGTSPCYQFKGDEIYVRAKIISSKAKVNPTLEGDVEQAWVQPSILSSKF